jgi:uncharacterized membrane-anchored protein YjiN (DUF445 family)
MEIKVDLTPEQINNQIAEAIAKSAIGENLKKTIEAEVQKISNNYNNPLAPIIQRFMSEEIQRVVREEYAETLKEFVKEQVTEKFTNDLLKSMWEKWETRY